MHDERRIRYLQDHLVQIRRAIGAGVLARGYFRRTLADNLEWAYGYRMRLGLAHVDFDMQRRTLKDSGLWHARVTRANAIPDWE